VLLIGFPVLLKKLESIDRNEFKNKPDQIFEQILELAYNDCHDYFSKCEKEEDADFNSYAKVLCLQPNLLRRGAFAAKNYPYAYVSDYLRFLKKKFNYFIAICFRLHKC
jgi:hypothetical protein